MKKRTTKSRKKPVGTILLTLALCLMIGGYFALTVSAGTKYIITDGNETLEIESRAGSIDQVLEEAGVSLSAGDQVNVTGGSAKAHVEILRSQQVTVHYDGETLMAETFGTTVGRILEQLNIVLEKEVTVTSAGEPVSVAEMTHDGMVLDVASTVRQQRSELVEVPFETVTYLEPTLEAGTTKVETAGVAGSNQLIYEDVYVGGQRTDTVLVDTVVVEAPVNEVILVGAMETLSQQEEAIEIYVEPEPEPAPKPVAAAASAVASTASTSTTSTTSKPQTAYTPEPEPEYTAPIDSGNTITTASGEVISYSKALSVTATAYTGGGITATGTNARYGAIAVDPTVIPYGTRMYIVSDDGKYIYGYATAEDCGGAIKGNKIDLYYDSYDTCIQFGRRSCTVYILN